MTASEQGLRRNGNANSTARIQRVYDSLSAVYPASSNLFHATAHRDALAASGIRNGMRVLEVATGSGEMFRKLTKMNPAGMNVGLDLSPNMAAQTQTMIQKEFPNQKACCQAADARLSSVSESDI